MHKSVDEKSLVTALSEKPFKSPPVITNLSSKINSLFINKNEHCCSFLFTAVLGHLLDRPKNL
jgi:hypothetical protein